LKLNYTLDAKPRHRLASLGNPKKKKCSLLFCFSRGWIFSKMERTFFFLGFCPQGLGQCGWASIWTRQNGKTIFWGKRIFRFTSALVPPAERGLGNECGRVSVLKKILRIFIKKYEK